MAVFRSQIALKSPEWTLEDWPWPDSFKAQSKGSLPPQVANLDIGSLNEQQQENQFKADVLALNGDL